MRSLRGFSLVFETVGTLVILGFVLFMLGILQQEVRTQTVQDQTEELGKIEYTISLYLSERKSEFDRLRLTAEPSQVMSFLEAFSDIYHTDEAGVITEILKQESGSRIFTGYDLSVGPVGAFLFSTEGYGSRLSPMIRSAEKDTISVYVAAPTGAGYLVGRIGLERITEYLKNYAKNLGSIVIIASHDGYIITSTEKVLPIQVVPTGAGQELMIGERYLMTRTSSNALGNDLVMLTPMVHVFEVLDSIKKYYPQFIICIVLIMALKSYAQYRYFNGPLQRFLKMLKDWDLSEQVLQSGSAVMHTQEIQALHQTFLRKSEEIRRAFEIQKASQDALAASQEKYRALFEFAGDAILILKEDRIIDCNGRAEALFACSRHELLGQTVVRLSPEYQENGRLSDVEALERLQRVHTGQPQVFQWIHTRGTGSFVYTEVGLSLLKLETGNLVQAIIRDITLRKEAEAALQRMNNDLEKRVEERTQELKDAMGQLIQAEKLASLGTLVGGVAHEINTPVGICVTTATFLQEMGQRQHKLLAENRLTRHDYTEYMEDMDEGLTILVNNLHRASELINGFKQIAVDQINEQKAPFHLKESLNNLILSMKHEYKKRGHQFEVLCPENLTLDSYPGIYSQIFTNLIMNSILHGFVETEGGLIRIAVTAEGPTLTILYEDNGRGIAPEHLSRIFDPFFTTGRHIGSSGLGLHIVFNLVSQKLKGKITCESVLGKGTRFTLLLPLTIEASPEPQTE